MINCNAKYLFILAFLLVASCSSKDSGTASVEKRISGEWDCTYSLDEGATRMSLAAKEIYMMNGVSNSIGLFKAKFSSRLPEIEYRLSGTSSWKVEDGFLVSTLNSIDVVNLSHPEFDDLIDLKEIMPLNVADRSEIVELSDSKMTLKSESDNELYHCKRALTR